jgi:hypothetical protein
MVDVTAGRVALSPDGTLGTLRFPRPSSRGSERSERVRGDGRAAAADTPGHAASASVVGVHSAANTAGARIPSELCGRLRL